MIVGKPTGQNKKMEIAVIKISLKTCKMLHTHNGDSQAMNLLSFCNSSFFFFIEQLQLSPQNGHRP